MNLISIAAGTGLIGLGLRTLQWSAYDATVERFSNEVQLMIPLYILTIGIALFFAVYTRKLRVKSRKQPFGCANPIYMAGMTLSTFGFLGSGLLGLLTGMQHLRVWQVNPDRVLLTEPLSLLLCAALCFPSAFSVLKMGQENYRGTTHSKASLYSLFPPFVGVFWLLSTHMEHATDPILLRYGYLMLAIVLTTLSSYCIAGFFHRNAHPVSYLFFSAMGITAVMVSFCDQGISVFSRGLLITFYCYTTAQLFAYLNSTKQRTAHS